MMPELYEHDQRPKDREAKWHEFASSMLLACSSKSSKSGLTSSLEFLTGVFPLSRLIIKISGFAGKEYNSLDYNVRFEIAVPKSVSVQSFASVCSGIICVIVRRALFRRYKPKKLRFL